MAEAPQCQVKNDFKAGQGLCQISADYLNMVANMLNGLTLVPTTGIDAAERVGPSRDGTGWQIRIPTGGGGLPSNAGKKKYMGIYLAFDNNTAEDNPGLWTVDWLRAHA